ncbi:MAG: hypothetical protein ACFFAJ_07810 [Candidatus Hodarchaeota archaeon]
MNNTDYRTSTSISSEIYRMMRDIENNRALTSDFYEELRTHVKYLKTFKKGGPAGLDEKKNRFKRIGVLLEELKEKYWDLADLLIDLEGIEILESSLPERGTHLSREIIELLKQMEPTLRNAHKSLRSSELGPVTKDLYSMLNNSKFSELNEVLKNLSTEIDKNKLEDLKQKRIL